MPEFSWTVKDWHKFQHFKDRRPPWIKLYRDILDDPEWHELDPKAAKALVMIWLMASENEGKLPCIKKLAFRLRMSETHTEALCIKLSHWLRQDDINAISGCHQLDAPERAREEGETETETETEIPQRESTPRKAIKPAKNRRAVYPDAFEAFYLAYPRHRLSDKRAVFNAWENVDGNFNREQIKGYLEIEKRSTEWLKEQGHFIPNADKWLLRELWKRPQECALSVWDDEPRSAALVAMDAAEKAAKSDRDEVLVDARTLIADLVKRQVDKDPGAGPKEER